MRRRVRPAGAPAGPRSRRGRRRTHRHRAARGPRGRRGAATTRQLACGNSVRKSPSSCGIHPPSDRVRGRAPSFPWRLRPHTPIVGAMPTPRRQADSPAPTRNANSLLTTQNASPSLSRRVRRRIKSEQGFPGLRTTARDEMLSITTCSGKHRRSRPGMACRSSDKVCPTSRKQKPSPSARTRCYPG